MTVMWHNISTINSENWTIYVTVKMNNLHLANITGLYKIS